VQLERRWGREVKVKSAKRRRKPGKSIETKKMREGTEEERGLRFVREGIGLSGACNRTNAGRMTGRFIRVD